MNRSLVRSIAVGLGVASAAAPAVASDASVAGPIDRFGSTAAQQVQITAGTKEDTASVALEVARWPVRTSDDGRTIVQSTDHLGIIVSTPFNGSDDAAPATLDGLANGTKVTLRWGRFIGYRSVDYPQEAEDIENRARSLCVEEANDKFSKLLASLGPQPDQTKVAATEQIHAADLQECNDPAGGSGNLIADYLPDLERRYNTALAPADARQFGFEVSVGHKKFEFIDPVNLAPLSETKTPWSMKGSFAQYLRQSKTAVIASIAYEHAFKGADEEVFCPANPTNVAIKCTTAAGAPPEKDENLLFSLGLRHQLAGRGKLRGIAIAPLMTYDALDDVFGMDVPIYFVSDKDGGLTGGLRFGYRSDTDKVTFGVFIGAAFSILQ